MVRQQESRRYRACLTAKVRHLRPVSPKGGDNRGTEQSIDPGSHTAGSGRRTQSGARGQAGLPQSQASVEVNGRSGDGLALSGLGSVAASSLDPARASSPQVSKDGFPSRYRNLVAGRRLLRRLGLSGLVIHDPPKVVLWHGAACSAARPRPRWSTFGRAGWRRCSQTSPRLIIESISTRLAQGHRGRLTVLHSHKSGM